ncbi:MAG: hypothetical protein GY814_10680 [Gammaproteobacteria bacterium]|nr:hypothetical protein [Gammaproteobacteria bacterium]
MTIVRYLIVSLMILSAFNVYAENIGNSAAESSQALYVDYDNDNELVTNIPTPDTQELFLKVWELNNSLESKREKIAQSVKDSKFSVKDGVITAVVPGGLLYAAHKKLKHSQEKKKLAQVASQLDDVTEGLEELRLAAIFEPNVAMLNNKPELQ